MADFSWLFYLAAFLAGIAMLFKLFSGVAFEMLKEYRKAFPQKKKEEEKKQ